MPPGRDLTANGDRIVGVAYLSESQLAEMGFRSVGKGVRLSDKACIYGAERIEIGDYSRIDDFSLISAGEKGIRIGSQVHIACYVSMIGSELIDLEDFVGVSARTCVYSSTDDYSGEYLTNPTIPDQFKNVINGPVIFEKHSLIGAGCVILPGVRFGVGCSVGAMSLVTRDCEPYGIYVGVPAKLMKARSRRTAELENEFLKWRANQQ